MKGPENKFRDAKIVPFLESLGNDCWFFVKEAKTIRGIPDIIGTYKGRGFALEVKKSEAEAKKTCGRIVLQKYHLTKNERAGGFSFMVYPENFDHFQKHFLSIAPLFVPGHRSSSVVA